LSAFLHRVLIRRLALAALVIAVLLSFVALASELRTLTVIVVDRATQAAVRLGDRLSYLLEADGEVDAVAVQAELDSFRETTVEQHSGNFVLATIYDLDGRTLGIIADSEYPHIIEVQSVMRTRQSERNDTTTRITWVGGRPHIIVAVPLMLPSGVVAAYAEGMFAISDMEFAAMARRMLRVMFFVVAIVLVTTGVLYPVIIALLKRLTKLTQSLLDSNLETLQVLGSAVAKRDSDTDVHNYRVTITAVRLAEEIGMAEPEIQAIIKGAFLHDVGKIGVRDEILLKPGKLSDEEYEVMKTHVQHGLDIVNNSSWLTDATDVVGYHHEKYDGTGYFRGVSAENIPTAARIFAIADVFDALTSKRPYKEPFTFDEAMGILEEGRSSHFDPDLLDSFTVIAQSVYDDFSNWDEVRQKKELVKITERYFSAEDLLEQR